MHARASFHTPWVQALCGIALFSSTRFCLQVGGKLLALPKEEGGCSVCPAPAWAWWRVWWCFPCAPDVPLCPTVFGCRLVAGSPRQHAVKCAAPDQAKVQPRDNLCSGSHSVASPLRVRLSGSVSHGTVRLSKDPFYVLSVAAP